MTLEKLIAQAAQLLDNLKEFHVSQTVLNDAVIVEKVGAVAANQTAVLAFNVTQQVGNFNIEANLLLAAKQPMKLQYRLVGATTWVDLGPTQDTQNYGDAEVPHAQTRTLPAAGVYEIRAIDHLGSAYITETVTLNINSRVLAFNVVDIGGGMVRATATLTDKQPMALQYRSDSAVPWTTVYPTQNTQNYGDASFPHSQDRSVPNGSYDFRIIDHVGNTYTAGMKNLTINTAVSGGGGGTPSGSWTILEYNPIPEAGPWTTVEASDRGYMTQVAIDSQSSNVKKRFSLASPDSKPAYKHSVSIGDVVDPIGVDSPAIAVDFSTFTKIWYRQHVWVTSPYGNKAGKRIACLGGRGWIGDSYPKPSGSTYGTAGFVSNLMTPVNGSGNQYIRLYVSDSTFASQNTGDYGTNVTPADTSELPLGRWITLDTIIQKSGGSQGYRLYVDGAHRVTSTLNPVSSWTDCNCVWTRIRHMHGGTPSDSALIADRAYAEYYGGFFISVA